MLSKSLGTSNAHNVVHATVAALKNLKNPDHVANKRGMASDQIGWQRKGGGASSTRKRASMTPPKPAGSEKPAAPQGEGASS